MPFSNGFANARRSRLRHDHSSASVRPRGCKSYSYAGGRIHRHQQFVLYAKTLPDNFCDGVNVILSAMDHNFRRILAWLRSLLRLMLVALWPVPGFRPAIPPFGPSSPDLAPSLGSHTPP